MDKQVELGEVLDALNAGRARKSAPLDEDLVEAAGWLRRRVAEFTNLAIAGDADYVQYRMAADDIEASATQLVAVLRKVAGAMQVCEALPGEVVEPGGNAE